MARRSPKPTILDFSKRPRPIYLDDPKNWGMPEDEHAYPVELLNLFDKPAGDPAERPQGRRRPRGSRPGRTRCHEGGPAESTPVTTNRLTKSTSP
jgi:hypothetical protein